jgi:hypothetical protein
MVAEWVMSFKPFHLLQELKNSLQCFDNIHTISTYSNDRATGTKLCILLTLQVAEKQMYALHKPKI